MTARSQPSEVMSVFGIKVGFKAWLFLNFVVESQLIISFADGVPLGPVPVSEAVFNKCGIGEECLLAVVGIGVKFLSEIYHCLEPREV